MTGERAGYYFDRMPRPCGASSVPRQHLDLDRPALERDILKRRRLLCQEIRAKYAFMRGYIQEFRLITMCRALGVHRSRYYAWLHDGVSGSSARISVCWC